MKAHSSEGENRDKPVARPAHRGRPTKFTPQNIRQIINLVERGKTRQEIAEIIGVTPATLQVTCSKLGISLRQPRFNTGTGMLRGRRSATPEVPGNQPVAGSTELPPSAKKYDNKPVAEETTVRERGGPRSAEHFRPQDRNQIEPPMLSITMHYRGRERICEIVLTHEKLARLALEAEFRGVRMAELLTHVLGAVIEKNLFDSTLGARTDRENLELHTPGHENSTH
jgi:hypothetical protein